MIPPPNKTLAAYYAEQQGLPLEHWSGLRIGEGWLLYALVRCLRPRTVVELGTGGGCSGLWIAQGLHDNGDQGQLWTMDIAERGDARARFSRESAAYRIVMVQGDSHGAEGLALAHDIGEAPLILFDGDHTKEGTLADMEIWLPVLAVWGFAVFHDATREKRGIGVGTALAVEMPWSRFTFGHGEGYDAGGPHDNGLVIVQKPEAFDSARHQPAVID